MFNILVQLIAQEFISSTPAIFELLTYSLPSTKLSTLIFAEALHIFILSFYHHRVCFSLRGWGWGGWLQCLLCPILSWSPTLYNSHTCQFSNVISPSNIRTGVFRRSPVLFVVSFHVFNYYGNVCCILNICYPSSPPLVWLLLPSFPDILEASRETELAQDSKRHWWDSNPGPWLGDLCSNPLGHHAPHIIWTLLVYSCICNK